MQLYCTITAKNGQRVPLLLDDRVLTPTQLRHKVSETTKIPLKDLRLIFRGRMIKDDDSIPSVTVEYKLEDDSVLHCMGKPVEDSNNNSASGSSASTTAAVPDTTTVPNRTVVPPLSTSTAASSSASSSAAGSFAAASSSAATSSSASDPLSKSLARLKQNNPLSVYVTAVGTLEKVLTNISGNPMEEKYRKVKKHNAAFGKRLGKLVGGHDCMLASGFVVEHQSGASGTEEVYQLHASAEKWSALLQVKARITVESSKAKAEQERARQRPSPGFGGGIAMPNTSPSTAGGMGGMGMGGMGAAGGMGMGGMPNMNDPNMQNMMSRMMNNPEALGQAMQNPMVQQMMRNDPNVSPMLRQYMETMANNPAMLQQVAQRMQDPAVRAQMQQAMQNGGMPGGMGGMGGGGGMGMPPAANANAGSTTNASAPPQQQQPPRQPQNDQGQTEEEMIAEAVRRSLEDN